MKTFKVTPVKDKDGRIDIDVVEVYDINNPEERYPTAFNQFRIGEVLTEEDFIVQGGVVYNKKLLHRY
jgi:hypothetical protein